ncbi:MAG: lipoate--protein ligase family protein [Candidatus Aminicenantales bacterium]
MPNLTWRLIIEPAPTDGARNMAVDEHLFRTLTKEPATVVRFYQWDRPTASLGCGQDPARVVDLEFCRTQGIGVVRRPTGGKLVLHYREATYAVVSSDAETFTSTLGGSYAWISRALFRGLETLGLKPLLAGETPRDYIRGTMPCFSRPAQNEIEIDGRKIIGSAQKRIGDRFLQHGSIPLAGDDGLLSRVSLWKDDRNEIRMTSISEALGRPVAFPEAVDAFIRGFAERGRVRFEPWVFGEKDLADIEDLRRRKYAAEAWTIGKRDPDAATLEDGRT